MTNGRDKRRIAIQKAQIRDVEEIIELVNGFAAMNLMLSRGPQYVYENIRDFVIASDKNVPVYRMALLLAEGRCWGEFKDTYKPAGLTNHPDSFQIFFDGIL